MKKLALLATLIFLLTACTPLAVTLTKLVEHNDGARLTYVLPDQPMGPGLSFYPGTSMARGAIVRADGSDLELLSFPENAECTVTVTTLDCRLGDVTEEVFIGLVGDNVIANVTWRRSGDATVYRLFGEL